MIEMPTRDQFPTDEAGLAGYQKSLLEFSVAMTASGDNQRACEALVTLNPVRYQGLSPKGDAAPIARLLKAIDTSSNNGWDISLLIQRYTPDLVIVKAYQSIELSGLGARYTIQHAKQAQAAGCEVAFYFWLFAGGSTPAERVDFGKRQVDDAMKTVKQTGIDPKSLLIDMESYTDGSDPGRDEIAGAFGEAGFQVRTPWAYTAGWWWEHHTMQGTHDFSQYPVWAAQYDGKADLSVFTPFGGWTACQGKQYSGNPIDLSVFSSELVV